MSIHRENSLADQAFAARALSGFLRQFRLPSPIRGLSEGVIIAGLFLTCGWMTGAAPLSELLVPTLVVTLVMLVAMTASGVYRAEIWPSVVNIYLHSSYGLVIAGIGALMTLSIIAPELLIARFVFLFLFFNFFVLNTVRSLCSVDEPSAGLRRRAH